MTPIKIGLVVEGHGDFKAAPILFRRIGYHIDPTVPLDVQQPIRRPRSSLVRTAGDLERAVELAALKARPRGGVFVLFDSDDDCPAELAPRLLDRAAPAGMGLPVFVILPQREFEGWFLAAAGSIRGKRGLPADLAPPQNPEEIRGAKGWLRARMHGHGYSETIDQPALAAIFDLNQARTAKSFDKCYRDLRLLIERFRA
ncbi:MAG: DUF4276 family protein [Candidatus Sulfopaludibacter sp.]|nr:DUF4276 family protein [Candidatus Sulfopaludibacter sp.]